MPIGKVGLNALGKLGGGLGSVRSGKPDVAPPPPPQVEYNIILENLSGYILLENDNLIITET